MSNRGFTLIELLIVILIGTVVLLGIGGFYVSAVRYSNQGNAQVFLQRQGTMILEETGRKIRLAFEVVSVNDPTNCNPSGSGLRAKTGDNDAQLNFRSPCFYLLNNQLFKKESGVEMNLLSGSLFPINALCPIVSGTADCTKTFEPTGEAVTIRFRLQDQRAELEPMAFETTVRTRNGGG